MFSWFRSPGSAVTQLAALRDRIAALERSEALRNAEWTDTLDKFDRLYKRINARLIRDAGSGAGVSGDRSPHVAQPDEGSGSAESPLSLRQRIRGVR